MHTAPSRAQTLPPLGPSFCSFFLRPIFIYSILSPAPSKPTQEVKFLISILELSFRISARTPTILTKKDTLFWLVTPCISERIKRIEGSYRFCLQGSKRKPRKKQAEVHIWFTLQPWKWRRYIYPRRQTVSEIHDAATQNTAPQQLP
jgi:hypothetical protein